MKNIAHTVHRDGVLGTLRLVKETREGECKNSDELC